MTDLLCNIGSFPPTTRDDHHRVSRRLVSGAVAIFEARDELVFHLRPDDYDSAVEFISLERKCCPFLQFELELSPDGGPIWLKVGGPPGVTAFLRSELEIPATR